MNRVITDLGHETDDDIVTVVTAAITGCTGNSNFTMTTQLAGLVLAKATYVPALAACAHGDEADTTLKNTKKVLMIDAYKLVAVQVNVQAVGDRIKALSSGCPMEKDPSHQVMGTVVNFHVATTEIAGTFLVSVKKPSTFSTHGTIFAYWDPAFGPTPADKGKWFQRHSNSNSLLLGGFTPGVIYPFASAYKGLDTDAFVWSDIVNKMAGD